jgi:hypothetical protein
MKLSEREVKILPDGTTATPIYLTDFADSAAMSIHRGDAVFVGVDTLPFWFCRGLVKHIRETRNIFNVWTMGEPTTTEWEARAEAYLKERFPNVREVLFESSQASADDVMKDFMDLADVLVKDDNAS